MAKPTTRQELIDYCLRKLGAPVIDINVDEDQIEDRVDEALQFYQEYHSDAVVRTFLKHQITEESITDGVLEIPEAVISVQQVLNLSQGYGADMFNLKYQMFLNDLYGLRNPQGLVNYEITKQYLGLIETVLSGSSQQLIFSRHKNTLVIQDDWQKYLQVGNWIIIECTMALDPEDYPDIYNDMALKKYLTALIKLQWGTNLIKFEGMQLPGGISVNGRQIFDDAMNDIKDLEEEWSSKYEQPLGIFIG